jgi:hypothetical protein
MSKPAGRVRTDHAFKPKQIEAKLQTIVSLNDKTILVTDLNKIPPKKHAYVLF